MQYKIWKSGLLASSLALGFILSPAAVQAAGCYPKLIQAENRWNLIQSGASLPKSTETKVRHLLTEAAELRHQAEIERCLRKVEEASKMMEVGVTRHKAKSAASN